MCVCVKLIHWRNIRSSMISYTSAKKGSMAAARSCHPNRIILQTSGWFLPLFFQMFWYLVEIALKHLSVLNEQPRLLLTGGCVCRRHYNLHKITLGAVDKFPPSHQAAFWAGCLFPASPGLILLCPLGTRPLPPA